MYGLRCFHIKS